ncbi:hypothetical protein N9L45_01805, partial [Planctomycetota bacterium]|nr:hypothetical protein [Planctomycetota bacterium]
MIRAMNSGGTREQLRIRYHRDFDGMVSGAVLAHILQEQGEKPLLKSVNYDERAGWETFEEGRRFALVDFHFHPRAEYWFDHHPTTFLSEELRAQYEPSERWNWDEESPSCPPLILRHAQEHFGYEPPDRFMEAAHWSDIIDAARFESVDQAIFGEDPALRLMRALTASPNPAWVDELATALITESLSDVALRADVEKVYGRAARNRDKALDQFPPTVLWNRGGVLFYDAASSKIRRERFAPLLPPPRGLLCGGRDPDPRRVPHHLRREPLEAAHQRRARGRDDGGVRRRRAPSRGWSEPAFPRRGQAPRRRGRDPNQGPPRQRLIQSGSRPVGSPPVPPRGGPRHPALLRGRPGRQAL